VGSVPVLCGRLGASPPRQRVVAPGVLGALLVLSSGRAAAQEPEAALELSPGAVSLIVVRGPSATGCPSEEELRGWVEARAGRSVFAPDAATRVVVRLDARRGVHRAEVSVVRDGEVLGERSLRDRACGEVVESIAVLLSVLVAPRAPEPEPDAPGAPVAGGSDDDAEVRDDAAPAPEATAVPEPAPAPEATAVPETTPTLETLAAPAAPLAVHLGASLGALVGWTPAPTLLVRAGVGIGQRDWSLRAEGRVALDAPLASPLDGAGGAVAWAGGALVACGHLEVLALCGHGLVARSAAALPGSNAEALVAGVGASAGLSWAPWPWLRLTADAALEVPVVRPEARVGGAVIWRAEPIAGAFTAGVSAWFE
jgi:hypothetical protein